jgi:hypothetical protein
MKPKQNIVTTQVARLAAQHRDLEQIAPAALWLPGHQFDLVLFLQELDGQTLLMTGLAPHGATGRADVLSVGFSVSHPGLDQLLDQVVDRYRILAKYRGPGIDYHQILAAARRAQREDRS